jgi:AhpD family alkylhydroperoxidase
MTHKLTLVSFALLSLMTAGAARAQTPAQATRADIQKTLGFVPDFVKAIPDPMLPGVWEEVKSFQNNPKTALSAKEKELIGLAVAAQAGNKAAIYAFTRCARANGASSAEVGEAVAIAAVVRRMSTYFHGVQLDEAAFRADITRFVEGAKAAAASKQPPPAPKAIAVVDAASALADMKQSFGMVPGFMTRVPPEALPGLWLQLKHLELAPTALPGKTKSLISVAVAAQVPCQYCVVADTEFAKLEGASDREIAEAATMAGVARSFGALIDGLQVDEVAFRRDWDRMTPGADKPGKAVARGSK